MEFVVDIIGKINKNIYKVIFKYAKIKNNKTQKLNENIKSYFN